MRQKVTALFVCVLTFAVLIMSACGGKTSDERLEYEKPIATLVRSIKTSDSLSYVRCYAPPVAKSYLDENSEPKVAENVFLEIKDRFSGSFSLSYKVTDKSEITGEELKELEKSVKNGTAIKKAYRLEVTITAADLNTNSCAAKHTFYVGKIDGSWYICGQVSESYDFKENS